jgi:hypothetical protein
MADDVAEGDRGVALLGDGFGEAGDQPLALVVGPDLTRLAFLQLFGEE